jgi:hypothetical protein
MPLSTMTQKVWFNVKDGFGATGNNSTNDRAAIQSAIDAATAANGGTVYFPPGTYIVNTALTMPSNVTLRGAGMNVSTIKAGADVPVITITAGVSNIAFEHLTVNGNRAGFPAGNNTAVGGNGNVTDIRMTRFKVTNATAFPVFLNTSSGGWTRGVIQECVFEDSGGGWDTFGGGQLTDFVFTGCVFRNTSGQGFATTNSTGGVVLQGCHFEGPMGNGISGEPASRLIVKGCTFHNLNDTAIGIFVRPVATLSGVDPNWIEIVGNLFYNTGTVSGALADSAIQIRNGSYCTISGNVVYRMGRYGIVLEGTPVTGSGNTCRNITVTGNVVVDGNQDNIANCPSLLLNQTSTAVVTDIQATGNNFTKVGADSNLTHGILELGTADNAVYVGNNVRGATVAGIGFGSATTQRAYQNIGFNPQGVAAVTVTASPFTYTNGDRVPEVVYISGGTVSAVAKNAVTVFAGTNCSVSLDPGEAVTVTYTVAPTINKDRK